VAQEGGAKGAVIVATTIGPQHGATAAANRWRNLDPGGTKLRKGADGKWPSIGTLTIPLDQWGAYDKLERALSITFADHDAADDDDYRPPGVNVSSAQARAFLAQSPLDALEGPSWLVPVCTADLGYRDFYSPDTIAQLRAHFGRVEAWCDCRIPSGYVEGEGTGYDVAEAMVDELGLDGPAWGQCETAPEFDNAYAGGARRMIGQFAALRSDQCDRIGTGEVLLAFELYRNVWPWQVPDYGDDGAGVGGNAIGCYGSSSEGATYKSVASYKAEGYYVPKRDSVYAIGLTPQDWHDLG
jgi:hypothetical protein